MLLGDDDRPTRDEKRVTALFLLGFFLQKRRRRGEKTEFICVGKKSEYRERERENIHNILYSHSIATDCNQLVSMATDQ